MGEKDIGKIQGYLEGLDVRIADLLKSNRDEHSTLFENLEKLREQLDKLKDELICFKTKTEVMITNIELFIEKNKIFSGSLIEILKNKGAVFIFGCLLLIILVLLLGSDRIIEILPKIMAN